jgi:hypothetical protein
MWQPNNRQWWILLALDDGASGVGMYVAQRAQYVFRQGQRDHARSTAKFRGTPAFGIGHAAHYSRKKSQSSIPIVEKSVSFPSESRWNIPGGSRLRAVTILARIGGPEAV